MFVATTLIAAAVARSPGASEPEANKGASSTSPVENPRRIESTLADDLEVLDFDAADYAAINPTPISARSSARLTSRASSITTKRN